MTRKRSLDQVGDLVSPINCTAESGASADNGESAVIHDSMSPSKRAKYMKGQNMLIGRKQYVCDMYH